MARRRRHPRRPGDQPGLSSTAPSTEHPGKTSSSTGSDADPGSSGGTGGAPGGARSGESGSTSGESEQPRRRRRPRGGRRRSRKSAETSTAAEDQAAGQATAGKAEGGKEAPKAHGGKRTGRSKRRRRGRGGESTPTAGESKPTDNNQPAKPGPPPGHRPGRRPGRPHAGKGGSGRGGKATTDGQTSTPGGRNGATWSQNGAKPRRPRLKRVNETSAGGLVIDGDDLTASAALIGKLDRRGRLVWSLPKGHVELGETFEQTAEREVWEETGIMSTVLHPLGEVDYWFVAEGRRIHKTVHHFLLRATGGELSDADLEVTEVAWVPLADLNERLAYPDERKLVAQVADLLARPV